MNEEQKKEALKPFVEKVTEADLYMEEIRERLGEEDVTKVNDSLINMKAALVSAAELHEASIIEQHKLAEDNHRLGLVNNELYIKNSDALKGKGKVTEVIQNNLTEEEAIDELTDSLLGVEKDK